MTHETIGQLATALLVLIGALLSMRNTKANSRAIQENTTITKETRDIANGSYTLLMQENAALARELATLTNRPEHMVKALMAEHDVEQRLLLMARASRSNGSRSAKS